jgi:hypothetical protein
MAPFLPLNPKTLGTVPVPFGTSFFAIMGARSLNRLPSNLPRSHEDTIFYSAEAAWTVYFCSQGVNFMSHIGPGFASEFRESGR